MVTKAHWPSLMGTVSYIAGHIWKIIDDPEAFKQFFSLLWDSFLSIPEFLSHPIEFLESQQAEDAKNVVNAALEIMDDNTIIRNVFSTPILRENTGSNHGCHDININFNGQYRYFNP
uniref:Uncharacterized protein n=1 Tax=Romanomermis culicivorax TaxID=13658 RepID=A0A915ICP4_ROMCU